MKAWRVNWSGMEGLVAAETRAKAKAKVIRFAREADFKADFRDKTRIVRAPEYDGLIREDECTAPEYAVHRLHKHEDGRCLT